MSHATGLSVVGAVARRCNRQSMRYLTTILAFVLVACHDASAPTPPLRPLVPWVYVLTEFNGEAVPTAHVESGYLVLHEDSTYLDVTDVDGTYYGLQGRFAISADEDSIYFTPNVRSGLQPYAAAISRDSVRLVIPELGLSRLFREN